MLEFVAGYDSGLGAKPEPGPVIAFAAAVGVSTNEIVVVGDFALDVATARNAGARAVAVLTGPQSIRVPGGSVEPDAVVASIMELPAWLETARVRQFMNPRRSPTRIRPVPKSRTEGSPTRA